MRRDVIRLHGFITGAVAGYQPHHQAAFVQQQRGRIRADLEGPRPVFSVHPDYLLCQYLLLDFRLHVLLRHLLSVPERIDKWILVVHFLPVASSVIRTYAISSTVRLFLKKKSMIRIAVFSGIPHLTSRSVQFLIDSFHL